MNKNKNEWKKWKINKISNEEQKIKEKKNKSEQRFAWEQRYRGTLAPSAVVVRAGIQWESFLFLTFWLTI